MVTAELLELVAVNARVAVDAFPVSGPLKLVAVTAPDTVTELKKAFPLKNPVRYSQPVVFLTYRPEGSVVI